MPEPSKEIPKEDVEKSDSEPKKRGGSVINGDDPREYRPFSDKFEPDNDV